ncbi:hypothetical protein [Streptomyces sp. NBC_01320]|uniref:hypothetical protein n=1 Tax=Streptomyces sp. NBC_01320 TaxID=2903824 RepID=UPI002E12FB72|nr:hypothetical protein OG395_02240 [Streptomyces sp. NBC_01320]WSK00884.1 hypothetical protein OG395_53100 [Streptomyces sp. NBC_01320]
MNEDGEYMLRELQSLGPAVRADVLRVLDCGVQGLPAHWRRRRGVPQLMVFLDGPEDVRVTPPPRERGGFSLCRLGFATDQPGP